MVRLPPRMVSARAAPWHDSGVYLVLLAAVAILTGVVAVAMGWGGEMVASSRDLPAVALRARTAAEVAMLQLPTGLLGYQREATDAAIHSISELVAEREAEIARLREEVWQLSEHQPDGQLAALAEPPGAAEAGETAPAEYSAEILSGHGPADGQSSPAS